VCETEHRNAINPPPNNDTPAPAPGSGRPEAPAPPTKKAKDARLLAAALAALALAALALAAFVSFVLTAINADPQPLENAPPIAAPAPAAAQQPPKDDRPVGPCHLRLVGSPETGWTVTAPEGCRVDACVTSPPTAE